ncbi:hypothetical protein ACOJQI_04555 [Bacillus salacetis]|uniref:hypothetical protein n=1 Tax=Bacillus salacetis TaxID=2315464 RepID=UPI003BA03766
MNHKLLVPAYLLAANLMLAGCSSEGNKVSENEELNQDSSSQVSSPDNDQTTDTGEKSPTAEEQAESPDSQANAEDDSSSSTDHSVLESSDTTDELPEGIQLTHYNSPEEAAQAIEDYRQLQQTNTNLGHDIHGFVEGAAGHQYISWNEGRWLIQIDFPSDSQYALEPYEDGIKLSKDIVEYLETHYLPAPEERGLIKIRSFKDSPQTLIQWQKEKSIYKIQAENGKPFEAIQKAVDFGKSKRNEA